ncbi:hypothetical protein VP01_11252g1, partial [Puccinia sorghi]
CEDISLFSFVLFLPNFCSDGTLVDGSEYDVTSGPFLFLIINFALTLIINMGFQEFFSEWGYLSKSTFLLLMLVFFIVEAFIKRLHIILVHFFYFFFILGKVA